MINLHWLEEISGRLAPRFLLMNQHRLVEEFSLCLISLLIASALHDSEVISPPSCKLEMLLRRWKGT